MNASDLPVGPNACVSLSAAHKCVLGNKWVLLASLVAFGRGVLADMLMQIPYSLVFSLQILI